MRRVSAHGVVGSSSPEDQGGDGEHDDCQYQEANPDRSGCPDKLLALPGSTSPTGDEKGHRDSDHRKREKQGHRTKATRRRTGAL